MLVQLVMQGDTDLTLIEMSLFGRPSREGSFVGVRGQSISVRRRLVVLRPTGAHGSSDFIRNRGIEIRGMFCGRLICLDSFGRVNQLWRFNFLSI